MTSKEIDLGNDCRITLASLTFEQVEGLIETPIPEDAKGNRDRSWKEVLMAIQNVPGQETWDRVKLTGILSAHFPALDAVMKLNDLRREALLLSGYKLEEAKPGEAVAAKTNEAGPSTLPSTAAV